MQENENAAPASRILYVLGHDAILSANLLTQLGLALTIQKFFALIAAPIGQLIPFCTLVSRITHIAVTYVKEVGKRHIKWMKKKMHRSNW
jgi:hypothetical protein